MVSMSKSHTIQGLKVVVLHKLEGSIRKLSVHKKMPPVKEVLKFIKKQ